ncbi:MAG TPA: hypothetical protein VF816_04590 [Rhodocyclaceae bacterium]
MASTFAGLRRPLWILAFAVAGCASEAPAPAPRLERLTGAALDAKIPAPVATLSADEIVAMAKRGESAPAIIAKIDASHSHYRLGAAQIAAMLAAGVPAAVVDHMMEGERRRIFDDVAADIARRDEACAERIEQQIRQCQLQLLQPGFATCWPPDMGYPYWRRY